MSDKPDDPELWEIDRFVDEVEQLRVALGLDSSNFYLWGQSWGGLLAIEYALAHQENLKALVVSNMVPSIPAYNEYANPRYMELLLEHHYRHHVVRMPLDKWPDAVNLGFAAPLNGNALGSDRVYSHP